MGSKRCGYQSEKRLACTDFTNQYCGLTETVRRGLDTLMLK